MTPLFSRMDDSLFGRWWWTVDRAMLGAVFALSVIGIILVMAAGPSVAKRIGASEFHFALRHLIWWVPASICLLGLSLATPQQIWRSCTVLLGGCFTAMILVLLVGSEIKGAQRWLSLFGFSIQPSEILKPAFVVVSAWLISRQKEQENFPGVSISAGLCAFSVLLLMMQPDFGMTFVVVCLWAAQFFMSGLRLRHSLLLGGAGIGAITLVYLSFDHVRSRVDRFLNPESGDTYQVDLSLEAFRHGGIIGTGPGEGVVKTRLPDAHADFIFSVGAEEFGLVFTLTLIGLFVFIMWRGLKRALQSDDLFILYAVGGLLLMFGLQAFIHMGSAMALLPAKGMTLPFISYGGSSLLSVAIAMGIILGLTRRQPKRTGIARSSLAAKGMRA